MRQLIGILVLGFFSASLGCRHVGGKCDQCAVSPGEASLYAPLTNYRTPTAPAPIPVPAKAPSESEAAPKKDEPKNEEPKTDLFKPMTEQLGVPKESLKK